MAVRCDRDVLLDRMNCGPATTPTAPVARTSDPRP